MCSHRLRRGPRPFSDTGTSRQTNTQSFVGSETTDGSALCPIRATNVPNRNAIDVDCVMNDDTIGSERRVPLDMYGSGVQCFQIHIPWCISRSFKMKNEKIVLLDFLINCIYCIRYRIFPQTSLPFFLKWFGAETGRGSIFTSFMRILSRPETARPWVFDMQSNYQFPELSE